MRRAVEIALWAVAAVAAAVFAWGAAGGGSAAPVRAPDARYFHGGKDAAPPAADAACRNGNCHTGFPHAKGGAEAAFRNMHAAHVECLACHGKDAEGRWAPASGAGRKIAYAAPAPAGSADRHALLGRALACRSCHSDAGREAISRKGIRNLPNNFAAPIALKMIEERGKRWVTDDIR